MGRDTGAGEGVTAQTDTETPDASASEGKAVKKPTARQIKAQQASADDDLDSMFGEDDEALLEMISQFGKKDQGSASQMARKKI